MEEIDGYTFEIPPHILNQRFVVEYVVTDVPPIILEIMCGERKDEQVFLGCTLDTDKPVIFVLEGISSDLREAVLEHEKAHVNGWKH